MEKQLMIKESNKQIVSENARSTATVERERESYSFIKHGINLYCNQILFLENRKIRKIDIKNKGRTMPILMWR